MELGLELICTFLWHYWYCIHFQVTTSNKTEKKINICLQCTNYSLALYLLKLSGPGSQNPEESDQTRMSSPLERSMAPSACLCIKKNPPGKSHLSKLQDKHLKGLRRWQRVQEAMLNSKLNSSCVGRDPNQQPTGSQILQELETLLFVFDKGTWWGFLFIQHLGNRGCYSVSISHRQGMPLPEKSQPPPKAMTNPGSGLQHMCSAIWPASEMLPRARHFKVPVRPQGH